jgi:hypothetical protein
VLVRSSARSALTTTRFDHEAKRCEKPEHRAALAATSDRASTRAACNAAGDASVIATCVE